MADIIRLGITPFPKPQPEDPMERNRHVFKKGRLEFMGGPLVYEQGHGAEVEEYKDGEFKIRKMQDQERICKYPPLGVYSDPMGKEMGVDEQEQ